MLQLMLTVLAEQSLVIGLSKRRCVIRLNKIKNKQNEFALISCSTGAAQIKPGYILYRPTGKITDEMGSTNV